MKPDQLSQTAAFIAIKFYGLTRMQPYRSWFDEEIIQFYDELVAALPSPLHWYHNALKQSWIRKFFIFSEELLLPGDLMHILMRKYFIGKKVEQLLASDYDQLLVLGAGFDHLAVIYSQRGVPSFEVEPPRMASLKQKFVQSQQLQNANLNIIDYHFTEPESGFNMHEIDRLAPDRNTIVVAEGFFDYLPVNKSQKILEDLTTFFKNNAVLISTVFALDELSILRRTVFKTGVSLVGEDIQLGLSEKEFDDLLSAAGFHGNTITMHNSEMKKLLLDPHNLSMSILEGFYLKFIKKEGFFE